MKTFFFFIFLFSGSSLMAQNLQADSATVVIHKDYRVDALIKKSADINAAIKKANARTAKGYRLLVMNTNKRDEAIAAKTKIYSSFPDMKAYLIYQAPYFKLKAGNFKTREEAISYQKILSAYFPKGVFIVNDTIEVTPDKDTND